MTITVVKEQGLIRVLEAPADLPEGRPVVFVAVPTGDGLKPCPVDSALGTFLHGDADESAEDLFPVA